MDRTAAPQAQRCAYATEQSCNGEPAVPNGKLRQCASLGTRLTHECALHADRRDEGLVELELKTLCGAQGRGRAVRRDRRSLAPGTADGRRDKEAFKGWPRAVSEDRRGRTQHDGVGQSCDL